jgi:GNAT superfamily N-acetyltransferase
VGTPVAPVARNLAPGDRASGIATVTAAFIGDPMARWTWPKAAVYLASMPSLVEAFGGRAFAHGGADATDDFVGVALWLPPGMGPDEERLGSLVEETVAPDLRPEVFGVFEQMAAYHPKEPHWYLPLIGVDPAHQGKGHGHVLLKWALERCDRDRLPAYLESTNPRNISLYLRHGFEPLATIQVGSSPPLVPMLRSPR